MLQAGRAEFDTVIGSVMFNVTYSVTYVERAVNQPDIGLNRHSAVRQGGVERNISPVVIVGVKWFLGKVMSIETII